MQQMLMAYEGTVFDASKLAEDPGPTTSVNQAFCDAIPSGTLWLMKGSRERWMVLKLSTSPRVEEVEKVKFHRMPCPGTATLQPVATWMPGPVVTIPVGAR